MISLSPHIIRILIQRTFCSSWIEAIKSFASCEHPLLYTQKTRHDRIYVIANITQLPYGDVLLDHRFLPDFKVRISIEQKR